MVAVVGPAFFAKGATSAPKQIILLSGTLWTVPADWNSANNTIECVGSGWKGAFDAGTGIGSPGGGGAYARKNNVALTPGSSIPYHIGAASSGGSTSFNNALVIAVNAIGSNGGAASGCVGDVVYSGGNGYLNFSTYGGGGGAAGPHGDGVSSTGNNGGSGDAGFGGVGGAYPAGIGGNGTEWGTAGCGGGGASGLVGTGSGARGGFYGAGGGIGFTGVGAGIQGVIVITYWP